MPFRERKGSYRMVCRAEKEFVTASQAAYLCPSRNGRAFQCRRGGLALRIFFAHFIPRRDQSRFTSAATVGIEGPALIYGPRLVVRRGFSRRPGRPRSRIFFAHFISRRDQSRFTSAATVQGCGTQNKGIEGPAALFLGRGLPVPEGFQGGQGGLALRIFFAHFIPRRDKSRLTSAATVKGCGTQNKGIEGPAALFLGRGLPVPEGFQGGQGGLALRIFFAHFIARRDQSRFTSAATVQGFSTQNKGIEGPAALFLGRGLPVPEGFSELSNRV